jgi:hypothetical protein
MNYKKIASFLLLFLLSAVVSEAQTGNKNKSVPIPVNNPQAVKSSPAYAEVLLRKTELLSELESLLVEYTEEFPKVQELRFEAALIQKELDRLLAVGPSESARLTLALGKLMVRKADFETDLWNLRRQYNDEHPDVKRARRKTEIFEAAIREILPAK